VSALELPHRFGRYLLFDRIGQGGMAELFLARQHSTLAADRLFVVKLILPVWAERQDFSEMLVAEAKLAASLQHANIVTVWELGREEGRLFIVMDYVEGFDLAALLKRCSKEKVALPTELALHAVSELLGALEYAHKKDVVHRDVSPSNVLVSFDGEVKLCDFGIARANAAISEQPSEAIQGKAGYMSPEQARGEVLDGRADLFAAGIILWELLAGRKLYRGGDLIEQARAADVPELPARGLPDEPKLHAIVSRALARNRDDRYATAGDMRADLIGWTVAAKLTANPIRLGDWLQRHFGEELVAQRRARESAAKSLDASPKPAPALLTPEPASISYKPDEPTPESLSPIDISPPSKQVATASKQKSPPWLVIAAGLLILAVLAWLIAHH
jgi:serine/threonine-protein kinase